MNRIIAASASLLLSATALCAETFSADVWADNWFEMRIDGVQVAADSVPITTERSFNAESFAFEAQRPFVIGLVAKDFKQNDTGLEYIGTRRQQMGDGGVIVQIKDAAGAAVAVSNAARPRNPPSRAKGPAPSTRRKNPSAGIARTSTPRTGRRPANIPSARSAPRAATTGSTGSRRPA